MKKILFALAVALTATAASATVKGTSHDLTTGALAGTGVCSFCHMPHNSNVSVTAAPIWARSINPQASYTVWAAGNLTSGQTVNLAATQNSLACLSCHDGTIAMGTLWTGQNLGTSSTISSAGTAPTNIGTNLVNDHPVGVTYPAAGTSPNSTGLATLANATTAGYAFFGGIGSLECGSCHDPHNNTNGRFYRVSGDRCIGCHATK